MTDAGGRQRGSQEVNRSSALAKIASYGAQFVSGLIMPIMMGMGPQFGMAISMPMLMSLVGHLLYGVVTGLAFPVAARRFT